MALTIVPLPPALVAGEGPDFLDQLRSTPVPRPEVDDRAAGGLRAWLEDGVVAAAALGSGAVGSGAVGSGAVGCDGGPVVVRDGLLVPQVARIPDGHRRIRLPELSAYLTRVAFRLTVTEGPPRHPLEDALCAISVTERGPDVLDAVRRLRKREHATLRATLRARADTMAEHWRPVPHAWLPRTGERLRVPLAGGAVVLSSTADLVLGRPSAGTASVCLVRVEEGRGRRARREHGSAEDAGREDAGGVATGRALRALALAETLRSGARPWRVASYDPNRGRLHCVDADEELLVAAVHDALTALGARRSPADGARTC